MLRSKQLDVSEIVASYTNTATDWTTDNLRFITVSFKDFISNYILNSIQTLLADSPWFITVTMISLIAYVLGGRKVTLLAIGLMLLIVACGLWYETMVTLTQTLVATMLTMILGVILGVWIGRSEKADKVLRPFLDAGQTLPAFVYLVPILGLFGPSRFTAIVTGIVYSIPVVVKIVGEGIKGVSTTTSTDPASMAS